MVHAGGAVLGSSAIMKKTSVTILSPLCFVRTLLSSLIRAGVEELVNFLAGTAPPLSRYVTYANPIEMRLDVKPRVRGEWPVRFSTVNLFSPRPVSAAATLDRRANHT